MNEAQLDVIMDREIGGAQLVLEGDLVFANMSVVKEKLNDFLESWSGQSLAVLVRNVSDLDLSLLQLLEVVSAFSDKNGINCSIKWEVDNEIINLFKQTGFEKYT